MSLSKELQLPCHEERLILPAEKARIRAARLCVHCLRTGRATEIVVASSAQARLTMPIDINAHHNLQPGLKASISGFIESAIWEE